MSDETAAILMHASRAECTELLSFLVGLTVKLERHEDLIEYSTALRSLWKDFDERPKHQWYTVKQQGDRTKLENDGKLLETKGYTPDTLYETK